MRLPAIAVLLLGLSGCLSAERLGEAQAARVAALGNVTADYKQGYSLGCAVAAGRTNVATAAATQKRDERKMRESQEYLIGWYDGRADCIFTGL